jgi:uncharacterized membrane protein
MRWLTLTLENVGDQELTNLDVKLNSLDDYAVRVQGTGRHLSQLLPQAKREIPFQVLAQASGRVYISINGWKALRYFHWESGDVRVKVDSETATFAKVSATLEGQTHVERSILVEIVVESLAQHEDLGLEVWVSTPNEEYEALIKTEMTALESGERAVYDVEVTPEMAGLYTVYAYLYDNGTRIDRQVEYVRVGAAQL